VGPGHATPLRLEDVGNRHKGFGGGNLRAAIFGANDGLVSNTSLILGVIGASATTEATITAGIAGLLAGALSMAAGEYVSVRSQRELFEYQIELERQELEEYPEAEAAELALIYQARGLTPEEAKALADRLTADPKIALDVLAREELGLNPDDLGSPWGAAGFSFASFTLGALVPLIPFFTGGTLPNAGYIGAALAAVGLFGTGASLSLFTGRSAVAGGLRMLGIGAGAGAVTWLIGTLFGAAVG
jgi:vacuolar iron transporter family protein